MLFKTGLKSIMCLKRKYKVNVVVVFVVVAVVFVVAVVVVVVFVVVVVVVDIHFSKILAVIIYAESKEVFKKVLLEVAKQYHVLHASLPT